MWHSMAVKTITRTNIYAIKTNTKRQIAESMEENRKSANKQKKCTLIRVLSWDFLLCLPQSITNTIRYKLCVLTVSSREFSMPTLVLFIGHHGHRRTKRLHNLRSNEFKLFLPLLLPPLLVILHRVPGCCYGFSLNPQSSFELFSPDCLNYVHAHCQVWCLFIVLFYLFRIVVCRMISDRIAAGRHHYHGPSYVFLL